MPTLGQINNNYWNVKKPGNGWWRGAIGYDSRGHAIFGDPALGVRAVLRVLRTYQMKLRLESLDEIFGRYAPAVDTLGSLPNAPRNEPNRYAAFVAARLNVTPNEKVIFFSPSGRIDDAERTKKLLRAMAEYENGAGFEVPEDVLDRGMKMYDEDFRRA
jgi:hypothetical protein